MFILSDTKRARIIRLVIALIAVLNLVAIFIFNYSLPSFFKFKKEPIETPIAATTSQEETEEETTMQETQISAEDAGWSFSFASDTMEYDGSDDLDLMSGVSVIDPNGAESELTIFTHITTGNSLSEKIVEYSADTPDGQMTASRTLKLIDYEGPSISIPDTLPKEDINSPEILLAALSSDSDFFAKDGFGNDITQAITVEFSLPESGNIITCDFSVTNMFNDTVSAQAEMKTTFSKPMLVLTTTNLTLKRGQDFYPTNYVKTALDVDGSDISTKITTEGIVDSYTVGDYELIYRVTGKDGDVSDSIKLTVHIVEE